MGRSSTRMIRAPSVRRPWQRRLHGMLLGLAAGALAVGLHLAGLLDPLEDVTWRWQTHLAAAKSPHTDAIKIIVLDEGSLRWGREHQDLTWPWPREVYAYLLQYLHQAGARAVAFDFLFLDPASQGRDMDVAFGEALAGALPTVIACMPTRDGLGLPHWPESLHNKLPGDLREALRQSALPPEAAYPCVHLPVDLLARGAHRLASVAVPPVERTVTRVPLVQAVGADDPVALPALSLALWLAGERPVARDSAATPPHQVAPPPASSTGVDSAPALHLALDGSQRRLEAGRARVALDASGQAVLRFRGSPEQVYQQIPAAAVLESLLRAQEGREPVVPPETFAGAWVLIGPTAPALEDLKPTPFGVQPGVLIHATALDNLLAGDFLADAPMWLWLPLVLLLGALTGGLGVSAAGPRRALVMLGAALIVPFALGALAYRAGWWLPVVASSAATTGAAVAALVLNYATEGRQRRFIKQAFTHYLSPEVIERLLTDPSRLRLGGERRALTIFFSDLQGFTTISEKMEPTELTQLLNDYLSEMTEIILDEGGTLDKYEGDAIICFWNAPTDQPDHALRGVRAALRCQRRLDELRAGFEARCNSPIRMRIGMHTGEVVVGNMGSARRFDYTMLGDAANLASRLEGANKAFGTFLMISEKTLQAAQAAAIPVGCGVGASGRREVQMDATPQTSSDQPALMARRLGWVQVVGRREPVGVFEPLALAGETCPLDLAAWETALLHVRAGRWSEALAAFAAWPDDPVAQRYVERCRALAAGSADGWDGVWSLTSK